MGNERHELSVRPAFWVRVGTTERRDLRIAIRKHRTSVLFPFPLTGTLFTCQKHQEVDHFARDEKHAVQHTAVASRKLRKAKS